MLRKNSFIYKKEVFSPLEEINDVIEIRNLVKQIIQDVYSENYGYRLSEGDAFKLKTFIRNNGIDIQRIYDIKLNVLRAIIEEAKGLPLYFNRFFPVYCENKKGKDHLLAINHSGVRLVLRIRNQDGEKLSVLDSYKFDDIIDVQISTLNTVRILLRSPKPLVLHTQWVYEINDLILAFIKESKLVNLSKVQKNRSNDLRGIKYNIHSSDIGNNPTNLGNFKSNGHETGSLQNGHAQQIYAKKLGKFADKFNFLRKSRRNSVVSESQKDTSCYNGTNSLQQQSSSASYLTQNSRTHSMKSLINIGGAGINNGAAASSSNNRKLIKKSNNGFLQINTNNTGSGTHPQDGATGAITMDKKFILNSPPPRERQNLKGNGLGGALKEEENINMSSRVDGSRRDVVGGRSNINNAYRNRHLSDNEKRPHTDHNWEYGMEKDLKLMHNGNGHINHLNRTLTSLPASNVRNNLTHLSSNLKDLTGGHINGQHSSIWNQDNCDDSSLTHLSASDNRNGPPIAEKARAAAKPFSSRVGLANGHTFSRSTHNLSREGNHRLSEPARDAGVRTASRYTDDNGRQLIGGNKISPTNPTLTSAIGNGVAPHKGRSSYLNPSRGLFTTIDDLNHPNRSSQPQQQNGLHPSRSNGFYMEERLPKINDNDSEDSYEYNFSNCALISFRTCLDRIHSDGSLSSWHQKVLNDTHKSASFYNLQTEYFKKYDVVDHEKLISFTKRTLDKPLLPLKNMEESRLSLECFLAIMRYMGDYPMSSTQSSEIDCVYTLLTASHRFDELPNEVYCQLMKQLTENKSEARESHIKGWKLMSIMTSYFYVTGSLRPYLLHFILSTSLDTRQSCSDLAKECILNFETTAKYGGRKNVPGKDEILALSYGKSFKRQFYRIPGGGGRLFQLKSSTVVERVIKEICSDLLEIKEHKESEEFALYIVYPSKKVEYLNRNEYILDVTTELDKNYVPDTKNGYFVFFKRHIWSRALDFKTCGQCYIEFHYKQILADYLAGLILMIPNLGTGGKIPQYFEDDLAELACLIHRASGSETHPSVDDVHYLFPETLLENLNFQPDYWHSIILTIRKELNRLSPSEARIKLMETLSKSSQLFGSTYFNIKASYDSETLEDKILAINKGGIYFLPPNAHQIHSHHPYRRIDTVNKTVTPTESFIELKVKTSTSFKMLKIISDQCYEAFYMINWYMKKDFENGY